MKAVVRLERWIFLLKGHWNKRRFESSTLHWRVGSDIQARSSTISCWGPGPRTLSFKYRFLGSGNWCMVHTHKLLDGPLALEDRCLESSCCIWTLHNMLLVASHWLLILVYLLVAPDLRPVPEALSTHGA